MIRHDRDHLLPSSPGHLGAARALACEHGEARHGPEPRRGRPRGLGALQPCGGRGLSLGHGGGGGRARRGGGVEHGEVGGEGGHLVSESGGQGRRGVRLRGGGGLRAQGEHWDRGEVVQRDPHLEIKMKSCE